MAECERAEFLASLGADTAKLCDLCNLTATFRVNEPNQTCFALKEIKSHIDAFKQTEKKNVAKMRKMHNTKTFTFEVRTTMGHYAIVSPTYMEASETVREETREPVLSVRKCDK